MSQHRDSRQTNSKTASGRKSAVPAAILADPAKTVPAAVGAQDAIAAAIEAAETRAETVIEAPALKAPEKLAETAAEAIKTTTETAAAQAEPVVEAVTEAAAEVVDTVTAAAETVVEAAAETAGETVEAETAASEAVIEAAADAAVETLDGLHAGASELAETVAAPAIEAAFALVETPFLADVKVFAEIAPVRVLKDVSREWASYAQDRFQRRVEGLNEILECRSPFAAIAVQQRFAVEELEALVAAGARTARMAAAPVQAEATVQGRSVGLEL